MDRVRGMAITILLLVTSGSLFSRSVRADPPRAHLVDPCRAAPPNRVYELGPAPGRVGGASPDASYSAATNACRRYVVDVNVSPIQQFSGIRLEAGFRESLVPLDDLTESQCATVGVDVTYYKKDPGQALFTRIGGGRLRGRWIAEINGRSLLDPVCEIEKAPDFEDPSVLGPAGATVYRVAVSGVIGVVPRVVEGGARLWQAMP